MHKININLHNLKTALIFSMEISRDSSSRHGLRTCQITKKFVAPRPRSEGGGSGINPPPPPRYRTAKKARLVRVKLHAPSNVIICTHFAPSCLVLGYEGNTLYSLDFAQSKTYWTSQNCFLFISIKQFLNNLAVLDTCIYLLD